MGAHGLCRLVGCLDHRLSVRWFLYIHRTQTMTCFLFSRSKEDRAFVAAPGLWARECRPAEGPGRDGRDGERCRGNSPEELADGELTAQQV